jgi:general secretion pathway protein A
MYCDFYRLKEKPFNVTADPAFFFSSKKHQEALSHLIYGINQRAGIIVITGEIGTGKTTLCKAFLNQLEKDVKTAFILNSNFSELELLEAIAEDFGIKTRRKNRVSFIFELNKMLLKSGKRNNNVVLIIDEAQNLKPRQLEQVRLLSNLETEKEKLIQIILVGQPELNRKLDLYELRQLKQRIAVKYHIYPLEKDETQQYIIHRLNIAGANGNLTFSEEAIDRIYGFSAGVPRLVNIVCDRALLAGFIEGKVNIDAGIIEKALAELK